MNYKLLIGFLIVAISSEINGRYIDEHYYEEGDEANLTETTKKVETNEINRLIRNEMQKREIDDEEHNEEYEVENKEESKKYKKKKKDNKEKAETDEEDDESKVEKKKNKDKKKHRNHHGKYFTI